jgi:hypothetical protein
MMALFCPLCTYFDINAFVTEKYGDPRIPFAALKLYALSRTMILKV